MPKKFKPGEWVKIKGKSSAPKMKVIQYMPRKDSLFGSIDNDSYVECVWYKGGERKVEVFHQNKLIKLIKIGDLSKT